MSLTAVSGVCNNLTPFERDDRDATQVCVLRQNSPSITDTK